MPFYARRGRKGYQQKMFARLWTTAGQSGQVVDIAGIIYVGRVTGRDGSCVTAGEIPLLAFFIFFLSRGAKDPE
jgi:hypothetical protein